MLNGCNSPAHDCLVHGDHLKQRREDVMRKISLHNAVWISPLALLSTDVLIITLKAVGNECDITDATWNNEMFLGPGGLARHRKHRG